MLEEPKSRRHTWDQFDDNELTNVFCRLRRELGYTETEIPNYKYRAEIETAINWMAQEKGRRSIQSKAERRA